MRLMRRDGRKVGVGPIIVGACACAVGLAIATAAAGLPVMLNNTDMRSTSVKEIDLPRPRPRLCQAACDNDSLCVAWSFSRPNASGPRANCWLMYGAATVYASPCCIAGHK